MILYVEIPVLPYTGRIYFSSVFLNTTHSTAYKGHI